MFDPGAIGTLLIGLDHIRREETEGPRRDRRPRPVRPSRWAVIRLAAAKRLRRLADALEPAPRPRTAA